MQHQEDKAAAGFGKNTGGLGIVIVAAVAVVLAIFCWNFWKDGSKEADHYRLTKTAATGGHEGHEASAEGHEAGAEGHEAPAAAGHEAGAEGHEAPAAAHSDSAAGHEAEKH